MQKYRFLLGITILYLVLIIYTSIEALFSIKLPDPFKNLFNISLIICYFISFSSIAFIMQRYHQKSWMQLSVVLYIIGRFLVSILPLVISKASFGLTNAFFLISTYGLLIIALFSVRIKSLQYLFQLLAVSMLLMGLIRLVVPFITNRLYHIPNFYTIYFYAITLLSIVPIIVIAALLIKVLQKTERAKEADEGNLFIGEDVEFLD